MMTDRSALLAPLMLACLAACSAQDNSGYEVTSPESVAADVCYAAAGGVYEKLTGDALSIPDLSPDNGAVVTDQNERAIIWTWQVPAKQTGEETITCQTDLDGGVYDLTIGGVSVVTQIDRKYLSAARTRWSGR